jgi:hypothetical protein
VISSAALTWAGIVACVAHSAMFSGLNLALFSLSRLRLEIDAERGVHGAGLILQLRQDSNFLLTTVLWGNVAVNCLLTLLSDSVLAGVTAFLFSTIGITVVGEILPQAYFSRHAMRTGAFLAPVLRFYQIVLYPVAKPSAMLLDMWLGSEGVSYFREKELRAVIEKHMHAEEADVAREEGLGALNFLELDDLPMSSEGEQVDPASVISLPVNVDLPVFPAFEPVATDPFVRRIQASGRKWVVLTDPSSEPLLVLDADAFLRGVLAQEAPYNPYESCHRPIVVRDPSEEFGGVLPRLRVRAEHPEDDVIDHDLILLWGKERRIVTGADILGRLLRGIVSKERSGARSEAPLDPS